jgi:hypothetical protein
MWRQIRFILVLLFLSTALFAQNVQRSEMSFNVQWYGAVPNDGIDDTAAFVAAVAAVPSYGRIYAPRGAYNLSSTVLVNKHRIHIEGDGPWATTIYFSPSSNDVPVFDFNSSPGVNYQGSLRRMSFISTNTTLKKIAVRLTDVSGFVMEDVAIGPVGNWTGADSIGVQVRGRDLSQLSRLSIAADMPIKVEHNANTTAPLEDLDVWHFNDLSLYAASNKYCITIDDGAQPTDFVMDGSNDFISGLGGFYWNDTNTSPAGMAYNLTIRNTRSEGLNGGWVVYVSTARAIRHVTLDNVKGGAGEAWKGFYFRGVRYLQLLNSGYYGTSDNVGTNNAVALDVDNVLSVSFLNCFWNWGSVRNMGNLRRLQGINQNLESNIGTYTTEYWESDANTNMTAGLAMQIGGGTPGATGANLVGGSGTLANGAQIQIPTAGASAKVLYIQVFTNGTGGRTEGGTALISASSVTKLNGTAGFDVVAGTNRIAIDTSGGWWNVVLRNTTGVEMSFGYTVWWI